MGACIHASSASSASSSDVSISARFNAIASGREKTRVSSSKGSGAAGTRANPGAGGTAAVAGVLSMSELVIAARVTPPGFPLVAGAILNAVHYQRPDTVLLAVLALIAFGLAAGAVALAVFVPLRRR